MRRIAGTAAVIFLAFLSLASTAYSGLYGGVVYFTDGETAHVEDIKAMNHKKYGTRFITYDGNRVFFDDIAAIEFPGGLDYRDSYEFVLTRRGGEKVSGWINSLKDYGYMWGLSSAGKAEIYKLNKGVWAESKKEIKKITLDKSH